MTDRSADPAAPPAPSPVLVAGRWRGREAFAQAARAVLGHAADHGLSPVILSDFSFWDWPLGERGLVDDLNRWARTGRRFITVAAQYDDIVRRHARFVTWRRTWSHVVDCWKAPARDPGDVPSLIWTPHWVLHRIDPEEAVFVLGHEADRRVLLREQIDEVLRGSAPSFPATTLGL